MCLTASAEVQGSLCKFSFSSSVLAACLPLAQRRPQPLLPGPKGSIFAHPASQLPPTADQGFVNHFDRFLPILVPIGHNQSSIC